MAKAAKKLFFLALVAALAVSIIVPIAAAQEQKKTQTQGQQGGLFNFFKWFGTDVVGKGISDFTKLGEGIMHPQAQEGTKKEAPKAKEPVRKKLPTVSAANAPTVWKTLTSGALPEATVKVKMTFVSNPDVQRKNYRDARSKYYFLEKEYPIVLTVSKDLRTARSEAVLVYPENVYSSVGGNEEKDLVFKFNPPKIFFISNGEGENIDISAMNKVGKEIQARERVLDSYGATIRAFMDPQTAAPYHGMTLEFDASKRTIVLLEKVSLSGYLEIQYSVPDPKGGEGRKLPARRIPVVIMADPCKNNDFDAPITDLGQVKTIAEEIAVCNVVKANERMQEATKEYWDAKKGQNEYLSSLLWKNNKNIRLSNVAAIRSKMDAYLNNDYKVTQGFQDGIDKGLYSVYRDRYEMIHVFGASDGSSKSEAYFGYLKIMGQSEESYRRVLEHMDAAVVSYGLPTVVKGIYVRLDIESGKKKAIIGELAALEFGKDSPEVKNALLMESFFTKDWQLKPDVSNPKYVQEFVDAAVEASGKKIDKAALTKELGERYGTNKEIKESLSEETSALKKTLKDVESQIALAKKNPLDYSKLVLPVKLKIDSFGKKEPVVFRPQLDSKGVALGDSESAIKSVEQLRDRLKSQIENIGFLQSKLSDTTSIVDLYYSAIIDSKGKDKQKAADAKKILAAFEDAVAESELRARIYLNEKPFLANIGEAHAFVDAIVRIEAQARDNADAKEILERELQINGATIQEQSNSERAIASGKTTLEGYISGKTTKEGEPKANDVETSMNNVLLNRGKAAKNSGGYKTRQILDNLENGRFSLLQNSDDPVLKMESLKLAGYYSEKSAKDAEKNIAEKLGKELLFKQAFLAWLKTGENKKIEELGKKLHGEDAKSKNNAYADLYSRLSQGIFDSFKFAASLDSLTNYYATLYYNEKFDGTKSGFYTTDLVSRAKKEETKAPLSIKSNIEASPGVAKNPATIRENLLVQSEHFSNPKFHPFYYFMQTDTYKEMAGG